VKPVTLVFIGTILEGAVVHEGPLDILSLKSEIILSIRIYANCVIAILLLTIVRVGCRAIEPGAVDHTPAI